MTIKAQDDTSRDRRGDEWWENQWMRLSQRLLEEKLRTDNWIGWSIFFASWAVIATAIATLEALT